MEKIKVLALFIIISACSRVQFITFESDLPTNDSKEFIHEDNTLRLTYHFNSQNELTIQIRNKTEEFVGIDWLNSSIVYKNRSIPLLGGDINLEGVTSEGFAGNYRTSLSGSITLDQQMEQLPPRAYTIKTIPLPIGYQNLGADVPFTKAHEKLSTGKKYLFEEVDSLGYFESYISHQSNNQETNRLLNHHFWVSSIFECIDPVESKDANQVRYSTTTAGSQVILGILVLPAVVLVSVADAEE